MLLLTSALSICREDRWHLVGYLDRMSQNHLPEPLQFLVLVM